MWEDLSYVRLFSWWFQPSSTWRAVPVKCSNCRHHATVAALGGLEDTPGRAVPVKCSNCRHHATVAALGGFEDTPGRAVPVKCSNCRHRATVAALGGLEDTPGRAVPVKCSNVDTMRLSQLWVVWKTPQTGMLHENHTTWCKLSNGRSDPGLVATTWGFTTISALVHQRLFKHASRRHIWLRNVLWQSWTRCYATSWAVTCYRDPHIVENIQPRETNPW